MTLILGLKCRGGIVLGADGAATFGALGQRTIRQPTRKLSIIRDDGVVMGTSGPVGLGQQYVGAVGDLWDSRLLQGKPAHTAMMMIQQSLWPHCEQQIRIAQVSQQTFGQNLALQSAVATSVLALPLDGEPRLFQFDHQCAPEEASEDLPFIAIGSGEAIADPFLAFLRRIFWPTTLPSLVDGVFAAFWTLQHAIDVNPGGVAEPKQIITIAKDAAGKVSARELPDDELEDHVEAVRAAEKRLSEFKRELVQNDEPTEEGDGSMPPPPK